MPAAKVRATTKAPGFVSAGLRDPRGGRLSPASEDSRSSARSSLPAINGARGSSMAGDYRSGRRSGSRGEVGERY